MGLYGDAFQTKELNNSSTKDNTEKIHINFEWGKIEKIDIDDQIKQEDELKQSTEGLHSTITSISSQMPIDLYSLDTIKFHQNYSKSETPIIQNFEEQNKAIEKDIKKIST